MKYLRIIIPRVKKAHRTFFMYYGILSLQGRERCGLQLVLERDYNVSSKP